MIDIKTIIQISNIFLISLAYYPLNFIFGYNYVYTFKGSKYYKQFKLIDESKSNIINKKNYFKSLNKLYNIPIEIDLIISLIKLVSILLILINSAFVWKNFILPEGSFVYVFVIICLNLFFFNYFTLNKVSNIKLKIFFSLVLLFILINYNQTHFLIYIFLMTVVHPNIFKIKW